MGGIMVLIVVAMLALVVILLGAWFVVAVLRSPKSPRPGELRAGESPHGGTERSAANRSTWMLGGGGGAG